MNLFGDFLGLFSGEHRIQPVGDSEPDDSEDTELPYSLDSIGLDDLDGLDDLNLDDDLDLDLDVLDVDAEEVA